MARVKALAFISYLTIPQLSGYAIFKFMNQQEIVTYIRGVIASQYESQAGFAHKNGLSVQYVNDVLNGRRSPGRKMLKAIGARKVVSYELEDDR